MIKNQTKRFPERLVTTKEVMGKKAEVVFVKITENGYYQLEEFANHPIGVLISPPLPYAAFQADEKHIYEEVFIEPGEDEGTFTFAVGDTLFGIQYTENGICSVDIKVTPQNIQGIIDIIESEEDEDLMLFGGKEQRDVTFLQLPTLSLEDVRKVLESEMKEGAEFSGMFRNLLNKITQTVYARKP